MTIKRMSNHANITTVRGERKHIKAHPDLPYSLFELLLLLQILP